MNTRWNIVCPVTYRHRGAPPRIKNALDGLDEDRVKIIRHDLTDPIDPVTRHIIGPIDIIMNVASESHVDRSIATPGSFIQNNVALMTNVLDFARAAKPTMFLHMSTDEVYGPADTGYGHVEWDPIKPSNPYSASKAAQEAIAFSYWRTYNVPVVITNTMNIYGETQDPEKFIPKTMQSILRREPCIAHVSPDGTSGSRFYLHARNLADAWLWLARTCTPQMYGTHTAPTRYNIVGEREVSNVEMIELIGQILGVSPTIEKVDFHTSRPGHDLRYALCGDRIAKAGWKSPVSFMGSLQRTVNWSLQNPEWLA